MYDVQVVCQLMAETAGKQVIYQAMMALCQEGDEVIVPAPYWTSYPEPRCHAFQPLPYQL